MVGKVCVVTAGTSGIGRAVAAALARAGGTVVVVGRDPAKGEAAAREVGARFEQADLLVQAEVRGLAARLADRHPRIDVLVNNAGGSFWERGVTIDGVERTLALNLLAPFLLTESLVRTARPARIVNVATLLPDRARLDLGDPQYEKRRYSGFDAYSGAKTALLGWTFDLARRLDGVAVNAIHPGVVLGTSFGSDMPGWMRSLGPLFARLTRMRRTMEHAVETPVWLASTVEGGRETGGYWVDGQRATPPAQAGDPEQVRQIVDLCASLTRETRGAEAVAG